MKKISTFDGDHIIVKYFYFTILLFSTFLVISIFYDLIQIHIYRQDALYYLPSSDTYYLYKVAPEGRWINYLFFTPMVNTQGSILAIFALLSFGYFIFKVSYQWSSNYYYSIIVSFLFIQIPSFYDLLTWPATSAPAFIVLLLATVLYKKLNIFVFFILFGIVFFGTMNNYYYLLPLLYLDYLKNKDWEQNLKFLSLKLIPAWAIGFIIGYIITQLIVYINFDHFMNIGNWRRPNYIHSLNDLLVNITHSINSLEWGIKSIFLNKWIVLLYIFSLIVATTDRKKDLIFIPLFLFILIILIHYIIILPIGIIISPRTIVATWVGVLAIVFFIPDIKKWQIYILVPLIVFFSSRLYLDNHNNMKWYNNISNTHYNKLLSEIPKSPNKYKGIILLASDKDIQKRNNLIASLKHTKIGKNIGGQGTFVRWAPAAFEAGFKSVGNCIEGRGRNALWYSIKGLNSVCKEVSKMAINPKNISKNKSFYNIIGEYDGRIIVSFNTEWKY